MLHIDWNFCGNQKKYKLRKLSHMTSCFYKKFYSSYEINLWKLVWNNIELLRHFFVSSRRLRVAPYTVFSPRLINKAFMICDKSLLQFSIIVYFHFDILGRTTNILHYINIFLKHFPSIFKKSHIQH